MSVNSPVVAFVAMALAIATILAVGTLIAADIIHLSGREADDRNSAENPVEALAPLGSSLAAGSSLRADAGSHHQTLPSAGASSDPRRSASPTDAASRTRVTTG